MKNMVHLFSARTISTLLVVVLFSAACSSSSGDEVADDRLSSTTTSLQDPAAVEAWIVNVSDAWAQLGEDNKSLFLDDFNAAIQIDDTIAPWLTWFRAEAAVYDAFADKVEQVPAESGVEGAAAAFVAEIRAVATSLRDLADEMSGSRELQGSLSEGADLDELQHRRLSLSDAVREACFPFQDAVAAADASFPLIDCANSIPASSQLEVAAGSTVVPRDFHGELEPGVYEIRDFARPFRVEFDQPIGIDEFPNDLELRPMGDWEVPEYYSFWVIAIDELPVPGTPYGPIGGTVPFPDDLRTWIVDSGLEIVAEGTTELAEGNASYWTVEQPNWTPETDDGGLLFADFDGSPTLYPIRHNSTVWQVPHPAGPLVIIAPEKWEIPGAPGIDELTEYVGTIVATIEPIDGSGSPAPSEDSNDEPAAGDVATMRETLLNLEGVEAGISSTPEDFKFAFVDCDEPFFESTIPLAQQVTDVGGPDFGIELLEFESESDRDAHFRAVEDGDIGCEAAFGQAIQTQVIDATAGALLVYSKTFTDDSGGLELVLHVTTIADTGMLTIRSESLNNVNAALDQVNDALDDE